MRPQGLEQPRRHLRAVHDDAVAVAVVRHELLQVAAHVHERRREALGVHVRQQLRALLVAEHAPHNAGKAARGPCGQLQLVRLGREVLALRRARAALQREGGRRPGHPGAVGVLRGREALARPPARLVEARSLQRPAGQRRHLPCELFDELLGGGLGGAAAGLPLRVDLVAPHGRNGQWRRERGTALRAPTLASPQPENAVLRGGGPHVEVPGTERLYQTKRGQHLVGGDEPWHLEIEIHEDALKVRGVAQEPRAWPCALRAKPA
mmetsp:Transcript_114808/g.356585  ORF Transcript_114808/g.356585 Transcript_114808/m.356585 type:complete len:265 (+) Transcript_114808:472-1266(+)